MIQISGKCCNSALLAFNIGDYVDYSDPKNDYKEFGTILGTATDGRVTIRPHGTMQGDFKIHPDLVTLVKGASAIEDAKPKDDEYTINLMWVNAFKSSSKYILPERQVDGFLKNVVAWAQANPNAKIDLWFDSAMVDENAEAATREKIDREFPEWSENIRLMDLRIFTEVKKHPEVFSDKTPVYFRVDLYRVIAANGILRMAAKYGERHYFVYADIDVAPMKKDEIFDNATQMDLDQFGIVMAHGGLHELSLENSFQIWSSSKPNLLKAAKAAIIDTAIARAKHILGGGYWAYKLPSDTKPLEQSVYNGYLFLFYYFYQLEGWGRGHIIFPKKALPNDLGDSPADFFGLIEDVPFKFYLSNPNLQSVRIGYSDDNYGKFIEKRLYIPRKIVDAPPSGFGGTPTKLDNAEINPRNFDDKLKDSLAERTVSADFLSIALANGYDNAINEIAEVVPTKTLANLCLVEPYKSTPWLTAINSGHSNAFITLFNKLKSDPSKLDRLIRLVTSPEFLNLSAKKISPEAMKAILMTDASDHNLLAQLREGLTTNLKDNNALNQIILNNKEVLKVLAEYFNNDDDLFSLFLDNPTILSTLGRAEPDALKLLRESIFQNRKLRQKVLLSEDHNMTLFFTMLQDGKIKQLRAFADDLLADPSVIDILSKELAKTDRFRSNLLHIAAKYENVDAIKFLQELFATTHKDQLRQALEAVDGNGKTALELAHKDTTKEAIRHLFNALESSSPPSLP